MSLGQSPKPKTCSRAGSFPRRSSARRAALSLAVAAALVFLVWPATRSEAHVKKIVIEKTVSPAFDGKSFGPAGPYETLAGRAYGELDPNDPHNQIITDIRLAPKNAAGRV